MKRLLFILFICLLSCFAAPAQIAAPSPVQASTPVPQVSPYRVRAQQAQNAGISSVVDQSLPEPEGMARNMLLVQQYALPFYRKPTEEELSALPVSMHALNQYRDFLKRAKTGIFKLVADAGCQDDVQVVSAAEPCQKYSMPGAGSSFSFRTGSYRMKRLADVTLIGGHFVVTGELMSGILMPLGDVPIEKVTSNSPGMQFIAAFQPAADLAAALEVDRMLQQGVQKDGYSYGRTALAAKGMTYVLRAVAYNGELFRSINGATYNELSFDKRKDITVVFRAVDVGTDGGYTIVWAELNKAEAPKLKAKTSKTGK